ncbi:MAG: hypothetical protein MR648_08855 [Clostridiales bacterium]|nr:hypothetical protein [Clostridiales bacterium]MDY4180922.1 hypothetical protein [Pseudoflavonifractor sp.]
MLTSEIEQQFYQQGGTAIQPAATEKAPAMDADALAALIPNRHDQPAGSSKKVGNSN